MYRGRVARDCEGSVRQHAKAFWFYFGMRLADSGDVGLVEELTIELAMGGMSHQCDLYANGYAPLVRKPSDGDRWVRDCKFPCSFEKELAGDTFELRWKHTFSREDLQGVTYFAFCYPFSVSDLSRYLDRLEKIFADPASGKGSDLFYLETRAMHTGHVPKAGRGVYFHREKIARTAGDHVVEMVTVTAVPEDHQCARDSHEQEPHCSEAAAAVLPEGAENRPWYFPDRPICFVSARVHPGETSGQFAFLGFFTICALQ